MAAKAVEVEVEQQQQRRGWRSLINSRDTRRDQEPIGYGGSPDVSTG